MKIILLGGVPGAGKTTVSHFLAARYVISTVVNIDVLKQTLKLFIDSNERYLYTTSHSAYKIENLDSVSGYLKHADFINKYVMDLIKNIKDNIIIVEGVTVNKKLYEELSTVHDVIYMNIYAQKEELLTRYEIKNKLRKSNWADNIDIIQDIGQYLLSTSPINVLSINLEGTLKEVYSHVEEFLYC